MVEVLPRLRRFARMLTGDPDHADDLVQETCLRALNNLDQWQSGTRLDSWMYRIAQNQWYDQRRAGRVRGQNVEIDDAVQLVGSDGRSITEDRLTLAAVSRKIADLPEDQQLLIALICVDGLSYKEAAAAVTTTDVTNAVGAGKTSGLHDGGARTRPLPNTGSWPGWPRSM